MCDSQGLVQNQQKWPGVDPKIPGACHICPNCHKDSRWNILRPYQSGGQILWQNIKRHQEILICQDMHFALTQNMLKIILSKKSV